MSFTPFFAKIKDDALLSWPLFIFIKGSRCRASMQVGLVSKA